MEISNLKDLLVSFLLFSVMHACVWWATNAQFIKSGIREKSLYICLALSIPISLSAFYAAKHAYVALDESAWSVRFIGFGMSYLIFPIFTWMFLGESMFTAKTLICILLSCLIVTIQVFW